MSGNSSAVDPRRIGDDRALVELGWSNHFQAQSLDDVPAGEAPARVIAVHRNGLAIAGAGWTDRIAPYASGDADDTHATVGDWLIVDAATHRPRRLLGRKSLFKRKAAGTTVRVQLIAANVDTLLVVTSCNQDFNVARLERYLAAAREAGASPVIVLTKADLADDPAEYRDRAERLMAGLLVECLDARNPEDVEKLHPWCTTGQTAALVGSSGVGKSTLVNTLSGGAVQTTAPIREDDAHGRHTTTVRSLHRLPAGGWLLDTPGMRELQLADATRGIDDVFADIVELAHRCRFADCTHGTEPGCAVQASLSEGDLDPARYARFVKLAAEDRRNAEALHERRARERGFGKMIKEIDKMRRDRWER